jgi:DNA-binding PadR family transcriptional regulator
MSEATSQERLPLRPAVLHILLALSSGERHGLGIADEVERASDGVIVLGPGTLYRSLDELRALELIEQVPAPEPDPDPRRKYYGITAGGRSLLKAEAARLARLVDYARAHDVLPERA